MIKILVTGGTGMLGRSLCKYLAKVNFDVVVHGFQNEADIMIDLLDSLAVHEALDRIQPDVIINLVCLSDVDRNEKDQNLAYQLNVKTIENIVSWVKLRAAKTNLIQISTDHVYDSEGINKEHNVVFRNVYAATKYCAERVALDANAAVLRTNFFGKSEIEHRLSFSDWIEVQLEEKLPVKLFGDVYFSPLSLETLVKMIAHVIKNFKSGIYNLGSRDGLSKAEFAHTLAKYSGKNRLVSTEISVDDIGFSAVRPKGMLMDVSKFEKTFDISLPTLDAEIKTHLEGEKDNL
jgi:dTDP-4-dehydrorhamnose reductase